MSIATSDGSVKVTKKRGRPGKPTGEGKLVRIDPAVVAMAKHLAPAEGLSVGDYLSSLLRPAVSRAYAQTLRRLEKEGGEK